MATAEAPATGSGQTQELAGKVAIVTGAGSGIGSSIARAFASEGAAVCINYFRQWEDEAKQLAASLPAAIAVNADISKADDVQALVDATVSEFGGLDVLVNNAGIEHSKPILELPVEDWDLILGVNLRGAFICLQTAGRVMKSSGKGGSIINISSIHEDVPFPGFTSYCAAKGGLRMMMRNAALELAPDNIRVNNIAPGAIATPINTGTLADPAKVAELNRIIPMGRMGKPEEVAQVAIFLASDRSSYVTGSTYFIDGGMTRFAEPL